MVERLHVLCVDDEPQVLEGLCLHLRRRYEVATATSGQAALEILEGDGKVAVLMSDMRMPGMNGAELLSRARQLRPDAVRILLTGQADLDSAIAAVNEGQVFRFLTKPCAPPLLLTAMDAAAEQHRLVTSERVLLEQTLHGSVKALVDVLSMTSPVSFGRAMRIKRIVSSLAEAIGLRERWQVEVAAMLSQLGYIILPAETVEKVYYALPLSEPEQKMVARVPQVTEQLLANIPRLEVVREILASCTRSAARSPADDAKKQLVDRSAQLLRIAHDFDALEVQGSSTKLAIDTMRGRPERYDPALLEALARSRGGGDGQEQLRDLPIGALKVGMVFAEDVKATGGRLLVTRGYEVTPGFLERVSNFRPGTVKGTVRVIARTPAKE